MLPEDTCADWGILPRDPAHTYTPEQSQGKNSRTCRGEMSLHSQRVYTDMQVEAEATEMKAEKSWLHTTGSTW